MFSILIPSWNNLPYLKLCLDSIREHSSHQHQIIVHVNEGRDGTMDWIRTQDDIDFSFSPENIGVCYALNASSGMACCEYIVYLNDDMYVCPGWDSALYEEIQNAKDNFFFFSATAIEPSETNNPCVIVRNFGSDIDSFQKEELLREYSSLQKNDWQGATWPPNVLHREVWQLVGGYSTEFSPGMYSDPDFSRKLWNLGVRLFKGVGRSRVYHFGSKSTNRVIKNKGYYSFINKWGMSSSLFTKQYLRSGAAFDGPLAEPVLSSGSKWKNIFKRVSAALRKT